VAKSHAGEIRENVESSQRSYSMLKKATADNKPVQEQLDTIEKHHKAAMAAIDKLDEHCSKDEAQHGDVGACCAEIHKELAAAEEAASKLMKELKLEKLPAPKK
jgi:septation ring formation regulator EzrA